MNPEVSRVDVIKLVDEAVASICHDTCRTCDCFQGFLTQIGLDAVADPDISDIITPLLVPRETMHGCLGCDPCMPGAAYARYLKKAQSEKV